MTLNKDMPQEIEFSTRKEIIADLRKNPIVRTRKDDVFKITEKDLDPATAFWRLQVFVMSLVLELAIPGLLGALVYLITLHIIPEFVIPILPFTCAVALYLTLVLILATKFSSTAYVTLPTVAWGISRGGVLINVKGPGRIWYWPWIESVYGLVNTEERVMYVPANQSQMRGIKGQSTIRVSLNTAVPYQVGESIEDRTRLMVNVTDADVSIFKKAEGSVSGWMRQHPYTDLIETLSRKQMLTGITKVLEGVFPDQMSAWYQAFADRVLSEIFGQPEMVGLAPEERERKSPGEEMMEILAGKVANWGISLNPFELSDIIPPSQMARLFERSEAVGEMIAIVSQALKTEFPGQDENWYRDAVLERVDNLIIYAEGGRPDILRILRNGNLVE